MPHAPSHGENGAVEPAPARPPRCPTKLRIRRQLLCVLALGFAAPFAHADRITLLPAADTAIMESSPEISYNFGAQRHGPAGTTGAMNDSTRTRAMFRFDLASAIPAGSTIERASFSLTVQREPVAPANSTFVLRRMLVDWIEGTKNNPENPGGRPASDGEPTWNHRAHPATPWGAPGGLAGTDFVIEDSASQLVTNEAVTSNPTYTWVLNNSGIADLQDMLDNPASNYGWMFMTTAEEVDKTARRFYFKETLTDRPDRIGPPPELTIDFTPPEGIPPIEVTDFRSEGSNIELAFLANAGLSYAIEVNGTLDPNAWTQVQTLEPTEDGPLSASIPIDAQSRKFVRITASPGD